MKLIKLGLVSVLLLIWACSSSQKSANDVMRVHRNISEESKSAIDQALDEWEISDHRDKKLESNHDLVEDWINTQIEFDTKKNEKRSDEIIEGDYRAEAFFINILYDFETLRDLVRQHDEWLKEESKKQANNEGFNLLNSEAYKVLLFERAEYEANEHKAMYIYGYLVKIANQDVDSKRREIAVKILKKMQLFLRNQKQIFTYSIHGAGYLINRVNEILIADKLTRHLIDTREFIITDKNILNKLKKEKLADKKNLPFDVKKIEDLKMEKIKIQLQKDKDTWSEADGGSKRAPSSDQPYAFHPSEGTEGNLSGRTFKPGEWAITLDDGPSKYTSQFLDNLEGKECYSFFWLSKLIPRYISVVERAGSMGCERASHSFTHENLARANDEKLNHEINGALSVFDESVGQKATMFRCPYGSCGAKGRKLISENGLIHIFWNVDSLDWQDKDPESIKERVINQMKIQKRGVILFHDIHSQSLAASKLILQYIRNHNTEMKLVTVGQKIREGNKDFITP